jgi:phosphoglycolate phosphatase
MTPYPVELMIFDFDGTLATSGGDIASAVNHALASLGLPQRPYEEVILFVGDGVRKLIERSLGSDNPELYDQALAFFSAYYTEHMMDSTILYPGMLEVLNHFRDKRKVIVTNKRIFFTRKMTDALNITACFDDIIGADTTPYIKPDARLVYPLLERFQAAPRHTVVIGDGPNDILLARNSGVLSCIYLNGLGQREELLALKPDLTYEDPSALQGFFI